MSLNVHTDIELTPTTTKVPVPFVVVFEKRSRPDNRSGFKQVYLLASLKTQRERRGSPGHTFPSGDPREAREHGERCVRGVQQSYSAAALNLL